MKCSQGCLKCSKIAECQICDILMGYQLAPNGSCIKKPIHNCEIPSTDIDNLACIRCKSQHYLDHTSKICMKIPNNEMKSFCLYYHWDKSCLQCEKGFFVSANGNCQKVKNEINFCEIYLSQTYCAKCEDNFYFDQNSLSCVPLKKVDNCKVFSSYECKTCMKGTFKSRNALSYNDLTGENLKFIIGHFFKLNLNLSSTFESGMINQCVNGQIPFCEEYLSFDKCSRCAKGFFLDTLSHCQSSLQFQIPFCKIYQSSESCLKCEQNYFLKNNECFENETVDGCIEFDLITGKCLLCNFSTHFMSGGRCGPRINSIKISNCQKLSQTADTCLECLQSFRITDDQLKCLPHIAHCQNYVSSDDSSNSDFSSIETSKLRCSSCQEHFYLKDSFECLPQTNPNCLNFEENSNECKTCASGYYLVEEDKSCQSYSTKTCKTFNPNEDSCLSCYETHYLNPVSDICEPFSVNNCKKFSSSSDECSSCFSQFFLKDGKCLPYSKLYCKTFSPTSDECESCYSDFFLDETSKNCKSTQNKNCAKINNSNGNCIECRTGYYLLNNVCFRNNSMNCKTKSTSSNTCDECLSSFWRDSDENQCYPYTKMNCNEFNPNADECSSCSENFYKSDLKNCLPIQKMNCSNFDSINNICIQCENGFVKNTTFNKCYKIFIQNCRTYLLDSCSECHDGFHFNSQSNKCLPNQLRFCSTFEPNTNNCSECVEGFYLDNNKCLPLLSENCAEANFDNNSSANCLICQNGFYLNSDFECKEQNTISHCAIYKKNKDECLECNVGYALNNTNDSCSKISTLKGCLLANPSDSSKCSICYDGFYLNSSTQICEMINPIADCVEYFTNSNECKYCEMNLKPTGDRLSCEKIELIDNCIGYDYDSYKCNQCSHNYFYDSTNDVCVKQFQSHCLEYIPNTNSCSRCENNFALFNSSCIIQHQVLPNCASLFSETQCQVCEKGFYLNQDFQCELQNSDGCAEYNFNSNSCVFCSESYFLKDGVCLRSNSPNCDQLKANKNECLICSAGYLPDSFGLCQFITPGSGLQGDPNCLVPNSGDPTKCDLCPNIFPSIMISTWKYNRDLEGCEDFDGTSCNACMNGYEKLDSATTCTQYTGESEPKCFKLIPRSPKNRNFNSGRDCAKCFWEFYDNGTGNCVRLAHSIKNCAAISNNKNKCDTCHEGYEDFNYKSSSSEYICLNLSFGITEKFTNCLIYNYASNNCFVCEKGYFFKDGACTLNTGPSYMFSVTSKGITKTVDTSSYTSGTNLIQLNYQQTKFVIGQCDYGEINVISLQNADLFKRLGIPTTLQNKNFENNVKEMIEFAPSYHTISECQTLDSSKFASFTEIDGVPVSDTIYTQTDLSQGSTFNSPCLNWIDDSTNLYCVSCQPGYRSKYRDFGASPDGTLFTFGVVECEDGASLNMEKKFQGLSNHQQRNISLATWTNFDSCTKPNEALVMFLGVNSSNYLLPFSHLFQSNRHENVICMPFDDSSYFSNGIEVNDDNKFGLPGGVDNCQINVYLLSSHNEDLAQFDETATKNDASTFKCGACRPGFQPFADHSDDFHNFQNSLKNNKGLITSCTPIDNCKIDDDSKNTWMNVCETCEDGYFWDYSKTRKKTVFHKCITSTQFSNCLAGTTTECVICKPGYTINEDKGCSLILKDFDCLEPGIGRFNFVNINSSNSKNTADINFQHFFILKNYSLSDKAYCNKCRDAKQLSRIINVQSICTNSAFAFTSETTVPNCVIEDGSDCSICEGGYIAISGDSSITTKGTCTQQTDSTPMIDNCQVMESTSSSSCLKCLSGYNLINLNIGDKCIHESELSFRCNKFNDDDNFCEICQPNYKIDEKSFVNCQAVDPINDICNQETYNGRCLQCVAPDSIPFNQKLQTPDGRKEYSFECIVVDDFDLWSPFIGLTFGFDETTNQFYVDDSDLPIDFHDATQSGTEEDQIAELNYPIIDICLPSPSETNIEDLLVEDCVQYDSTGNCVKCASGYFLDNADNSCSAFSPNNCLVKDYLGLCLLCERGYSLNSDQTDCLAINDYGRVQNCYYKNREGDCLLCESGFFWNGTDCQTYSNSLSNCMIKDPFSDGCLKCNPSYFLIEIGSRCVFNQVSNCLISSNNRNECLTCKEGYQLSNYGSSCVLSDQRNMPNCLEYNSFHECVRCFPGFQFNHDFSTCDPILKKKIFGCSIYDSLGSSCVECVEPFRLLAGKCMKVRSENCQKVNDHLPICEICKKGFYNRNGICKLRTNLNCKLVRTNSDKCLSCTSGFFLKGDSCYPYSVQFCRTYDPLADKCLTCIQDERFYLNENSGKCLFKNTLNCQKYDYQSNKCSSCKNLYFLDSLRKCRPISDINCLYNDPSADLCIKCKDGFFMKDTLFNNSTKSDLSLKCVPYTITNCEIYHPFENKCLRCQRNHVLSAESLCIEYEPHNCLKFDVSNGRCTNCFENTFLSNGSCYKYSVKNCASYSKNHDKCLSCKNGFYLQNDDCLLNTSEGCSIYSKDSNTCSQCKNSFYLENGTCNLNTSNNCLKLSTVSNECETCISKHYMNNGLCLPHSINCKKYNPQSNSCISCPEKMYLDPKSKICAFHSIKNCIKYSQTKANKCEKCPNNFYLSSDGNCLEYKITNCKLPHPFFDECVFCKDKFYFEKGECLKYSNDNCLKYSKVADICLSCHNNHFLSDKGSCIPYSINNCEVYHPNLNSCIRCQNLFFASLKKSSNFLQEFDCVKITPVENCKSYDSDKNACSECEESFILSRELNKCFKSKFFINHCKEYISESDCLKCNAPYYMTNGKCLRSDLVLPKCSTYSRNNKCAECEANHLLNVETNSCEIIQETSCKTYKDPFNCLTCEDHLVLKYIDNSNNDILQGFNDQIDLTLKRTVCVSSGIPHCILARESIDENICFKCEKGYFLSNENKCIQVMNQIQGCEIYFSDGVCSECDVNRVLSFDKQECKKDLSLIGRNNCKEGKIFSEPKCSICDFGFFLNEIGECEKCAMNGCSICSTPDPSQCSLCKSGYFMNEESICTRNIILTEEEAQLEFSKEMILVKSTKGQKIIFDSI